MIFCVKTIAMQDSAIQESMGPIQDRSKENLTSTDNGVIMARVRLRKAALAVQQGKQPDGIDPATHAVRSASIVLPDNVSFYEAAAEALRLKRVSSTRRPDDVIRHSSPTYWAAIDACKKWMKSVVFAGRCLAFEK